MPRGRPRKIKIETEVKEEPVRELEETHVVFDNSPKAQLEKRLKELYDLRSLMVNNGVDSIGKLDNLIAEVLKQLK